MINYPGMTYVADDGACSVLMDPPTEVNPIIIIGRCSCTLCGGKIAITRLHKNNNNFLIGISIKCLGCNTVGFVTW
jgi:hypothetical protein